MCNHILAPAQWLLQEIESHPFFEGVDWAGLHARAAPYVPRVDHELDTQNFERFDEDMNMSSPGEETLGSGFRPEP
jgi:serine/threonine kinase 38